MYYKEAKIKKCPICGKEFSTLDVGRKYCSIKCVKEGNRRRLNRNTKRYERSNMLKFGIKKYNGAKGTVTLKCGYCGCKYTRHKSQIKYRGSSYCSKECKWLGQKSKKIKDERIDEIWSRVVKLIDGNKCVYCGKNEYLNTHHIFSRSNKSVRWYIPNGITLCATHHVLSSSFSAHKAPAEFIEWIKEKRGLRWYEDLRKRAKQIKKWTADDKRTTYLNLIDLADHIEDMSEGERNNLRKTGILIK